MVGKIVQLLGKKNSGFEVVYGIDNNIIDNRYLLDFGEIVLGNNEPNATATYIYGGQIVEEQGDGYKKVVIFNKELPKEAIEDYLLVIIPYAAQLAKTGGTRIAGRYYYEAILEMRNGDTVEVSKSFSGEREIYMAVQAGNEMFLLKKNR